MIATRVLGQGTEFAAFVVLARKLGPGDFGAIAVAFVLARYLGLVADWGAATGGARDIARVRDEDAAVAVLRQRWITGVLGAVVFVVIAFSVSHPEMAPIGCVVLAAGLNRDWVALGRRQGVRAGVPSVVRGVVLLAGSSVADVPWRASVAIGIAYVAGAVSSVVVSRMPSVGSARRRWQAGAGWLMLATVAAQVYTSADIALLGWLRSDREAGVYAAVYRIPNVWVTVTGLAVGALVPVAANTLIERPGILHEMVRRAWHMGLALAGVVLLAIPFAVMSVVPLFGSDYSEGRWPLAVLLLANAVGSVTAPVGAVYLVSGSDRIVAGALCVGAIVNVIGNLVVIPSAGMDGAAWTTFAAEAVVLAILGTALRSRVHQEP